MNRRRSIVALVSTVALCAGPLGTAPAPAAGADIQYVSGPAAQLTGWTQPVLVVREGDTVTYTNIDIAQHDVVSKSVIGPDTTWCAAAKFDPGTCPLIWSPLIGLGEQTKVYGLENVRAGMSVPFICTLHGAMKGTLKVVGTNVPASPA